MRAREENGQAMSKYVVRRDVSEIDLPAAAGKEAHKFIVKHAPQMEYGCLQDALHNLRVYNQTIMRAPEPLHQANLLLFMLNIWYLGVSGFIIKINADVHVPKVDLVRAVAESFQEAVGDELFSGAFKVSSWNHSEVKKSCLVVIHERIGMSSADKNSFYGIEIVDTNPGIFLQLAPLRQVMQKYLGHVIATERELVVTQEKLSKAKAAFDKQIMEVQQAFQGRSS